MKKYEIMYIVRQPVESEDVKKIVANSMISLLTLLKSLELKELGVKRLSYMKSNIKLLLFGCSRSNTRSSSFVCSYP